MNSPIESMIDSVVKCIKCGKKMKDCLDSKDCTLICSRCGWFYRKDEPCRNEIHKESTK